LRIEEEGVFEAGIAYVETDDAFEFFAGGDEDTPAFYIDGGDSTVGVGTLQTGYGFSVSVSGVTAAGYFFHDGGTTADEGIDIQAGHDSCTGDNNMIGFADGDGTAHGWIECDDGTIQFEQISDERRKENIVNTAYGLEEISALRIVDFNFIQNPEAPKIGVIAQEADGIIPEFIDYDASSDIYTASYGVLTPILVQAIQDLDAKINLIATTSATNTTPIVVTDNPDLDVQTLVVQQAATFYGTILVQGEAGFTSKVVFNEDIEVKGKIYASTDQAGTATIEAGATTTEIIFEGEYEITPKITALPKANPGSLFWASEQTPSGFRLSVLEPVDQDVSFDWIALAVKTDIEESSESPSIDNFITSLDSVGINIPVELWAQVTDVDTEEGDLIYSWTVNPDLGEIDGDSGLVYWTVPEAGGLEGTTDVTITVTVSDGANEVSDSRVVTLIIPTEESPEEEIPPVVVDPEPEPAPEATTTPEIVVDPDPEPEPETTTTPEIVVEPEATTTEEIVVEDPADEVEAATL
jgi:hypothetical protein